MLDILKEIRSQIVNGEEGSLALSLSGKSLSLKNNASVVFDFTDIDFNSKLITNLLTKKFGEFLGLGEQLQNISILESIILNLSEEFRLSSGLNIDYDCVILSRLEA